jgi:hypothetical protein
VARLVVGGDDLRILLSWPARVGAFVGGTGSVPLTAIRSVRAVDDPWPELRGIRSPGVALGRMIALGTRRHSFGKDFVAVYGKGPAVVVELTGQDFARLVISTPDAERVAEEIRVAAAEARMPGRTD